MCQVAVIIFTSVFLFYGWAPAKRRRKKLVVFIPVAKAERGKCVCGVWEVKTGRHGRRSLADANATLTN